MAAIGRITLLGPIAKPGLPAIGGYESANLRLLAALDRLCADVRPLAYPHTSGSQLRKALQYARGFARTLLRLSVEAGDNAAVHFTPLCRHFLAAELLLAIAIRARGNRLTVDLRAGMQESWYRRSSALYRAAFRALLSLASTIAYEGDAYGPWLAALAPGAAQHLLPNFVPAAMMRPRPRDALPRAPQLVFVGTLSQAKGVEAALHVFRRLTESLPGITFVLVGRCDPLYRNSLERMGLLHGGVTLAGALAPPAVEQQLDESHFFIFLSRWFGEGHSNALTEAMARGCVPIVAEHGFARSVVAHSDLTVPDREDGAGIATRVESIWKSGRWNELSEAMVRRVAENFTDEHAIRVLRKIYPEGV